MTKRKAIEEDIPILTDVVTGEDAASVGETDPAIDHESLIAELQTELAAKAYALTEQVLRSALTGMEAALFEQTSARLRQELPELIDRILRERLGEDPEDT